MKKNLSKLCFGIELLASIIILGAVLFWAPVCDGLLKLENGNMVHMKCFYTGQSSILLAILLFITAIIAYMSKTDHKKIQWIIILIGIMLIVNTFESTIGIGICKKITMSCHTTAKWIRLSGAISIVAGLVDIVVNSNKVHQLS